MRSKYINTFPNNTAYQAYLDSSLWDYPNVAHILDPSTVIYLKQSSEPEPEPEPVYALAGWSNESSNFTIKMGYRYPTAVVDTTKSDPTYGYFWYVSMEDPMLTNGPINNMWLTSSKNTITKVTQFNPSLDNSGNWSYSFAGQDSMEYFSFAPNLAILEPPFAGHTGYTEMGGFKNWNYAFHFNSSLTTVDFSRCIMPSSGVSAYMCFNTCPLETVIVNDAPENTFNQVKYLVLNGNPADLSQITIYRDSSVYIYDSNQNDFVLQ